MATLAVAALHHQTLGEIQLLGQDLLYVSIILTIDAEAAVAHHEMQPAAAIGHNPHGQISHEG